MLMINLLFAGVSHLLWHWGIGIGLIIILLGLALFSASVPVIGPFLTKFREYLELTALAVALLLAGEYIGAKDMAGRCVAQNAVISKHVDKVVKKSLTPAARARKDRYDSPTN
jgi:hypothetical protein